MRVYCFLLSHCQCSARELLRDRQRSNFARTQCEQSMQIMTNLKTGQHSMEGSGPLPLQPPALSAYRQTHSHALVQRCNFRSSRPTSAPQRYMSGPYSASVWPFVAYGVVDVFLVIACLAWLSVATCAPVRRRSALGSSTHPLYFDPQVAAEEAHRALTPVHKTVTEFQSPCTKAACIFIRLLLVGTGALITLEAAESAVGGWLAPQSQRKHAFTGVAYALEALHVFLIPSLLVVPLSWTLALRRRTTLMPATGLATAITLLTLVLVGALLAAGSLAVSHAPDDLQPHVQFGVTTWRAQGQWALGSLQLYDISPTVLALYTTGVGACLWWRTRWWLTMAAQALLLVGHFVVILNDTAAFFVPGVWNCLFLISLLHTDWMVWRADWPLGHSAAAPSARSALGGYFGMPSGSTPDPGHRRDTAASAASLHDEVLFMPLTHDQHAHTPAHSSEAWGRDGAHPSSGFRALNA